MKYTPTMRFFDYFGSRQMIHKHQREPDHAWEVR